MMRHGFSQEDRKLEKSPKGEGREMGSSTSPYTQLENLVAQHARAALQGKNFPALLTPVGSKG